MAEPSSKELDLQNIFIPQEGESVDAKSLLERLTTAKDMLTQSRAELVSPPPPEEPVTPPAPDQKLWEDTLSHLKPLEEAPAGLNDRLGKAVFSLMGELFTRSQYIAKLQLSLAEKTAILPVPYHSSQLGDSTTLDLTEAQPEESVPWTYNLLSSKLAEGQGSYWTMGGVRGALVCSGPIEAKAMFFQAEFARYRLIHAQYPKANTPELVACQQRARTRLDQVENALANPDLLVGIQFIYTSQGQLDWIPAIRKR